MAGRGKQGTRRQKAVTGETEHSYEKKEEQRVGERIFQPQKWELSQGKEKGNGGKGKRE